MSAITPDPQYSLTPSGNLRRRMLVSRAFVWSTVGAAGLAVAVLFILVYYAASQGIHQLSFSFLFSNLPPGFQLPGPPVGGMGPALVGTAETVGFATLIALPVGVLTAIYLTEFAHPTVGRIVTGALEQLAGLPTIVCGAFAVALFVEANGQSMYAASFALSIVEVPLISRATIEALRRVPGTLREAADALGIAHWRTVVGVILPTASNGIATATILAVARAAGETAPVLLTMNTGYPQGIQLNPLHPAATIPMEVYVLLNSGQPNALAQAWGAAFLLMILILAVNIGARVLLRRGERKRGL